MHQLVVNLENLETSLHQFFIHSYYLYQSCSKRHVRNELKRRNSSVSYWYCRNVITQNMLNNSNLVLHHVRNPCTVPRTKSIHCSSVTKINTCLETIVTTWHHCLRRVFEYWVFSVIPAHYSGDPPIVHKSLSILSMVRTHYSNLSVASHGTNYQQYHDSSAQCLFIPSISPQMNLLLYSCTLQE